MKTDIELTYIGLNGLISTAGNYERCSKEMLYKLVDKAIAQREQEIMQRIRKEIPNEVFNNISPLGVNLQPIKDKVISIIKSKQ